MADSRHIIQYGRSFTVGNPIAAMTSTGGGRDTTRTSSTSTSTMSGITAATTGSIVVVVIIVMGPVRIIIIIVLGIFIPAIFFLNDGIFLVQSLFLGVDGCMITIIIVVVVVILVMTMMVVIVIPNRDQVYHHGTHYDNDRGRHKVNGRGFPRIARVEYRTSTVMTNPRRRGVNLTSSIQGELLCTTSTGIATNVGILFVTAIPMILIIILIGEYDRDVIRIVARIHTIVRIRMV